MNGWVSLRAVRSALRECPIRMVVGVRRVRRRDWMVGRVVVMGARAVGVMPE